MSSDTPKKPETREELIDALIEYDMRSCDAVELNDLLLRQGFPGYEKMTDAQLDRAWMFRINLDDAYEFFMHRLEQEEAIIEREMTGKLNN